MDNNDILRRLRYTFDFGDSEMMHIFKLGNYPATREQISDWLKKFNLPNHQPLDDHMLAIFLNGLINLKRGKKEGAEPAVEDKLNNNIILRKLKIALNLQNDDMLYILKLMDVRISKHELSAFFRNPNQSQYRACENQILRNFLHGLQIKYRPGGEQLK
jgi:uncharacterized protein YehS (DUF1456 family)